MYKEENFILINDDCLEAMKKKPVVIEAFQYDGDLKGSNGYYVPDWAVKSFEDKTMYFDSLSENEPPCELFIRTSDGIHHASIGDYIIQGVSGEIYPCKPDIFNKTYEEVIVQSINEVPVIDRKECPHHTDTLHPRCMAYNSETHLCSGIMKCKYSPYNR